jgi:hypothetical protein
MESPSDPAVQMPASRGLGFAWVALSLALAVHVIDEALTDFLSIYNPAALAIRRPFPLLPLPVFTFRVWLSSLAAGVVGLLLLSALAFRGARWIITWARLFAVLMLANALLHLGISLYLGKPIPGVYSSPLLLAASVYLLRESTRKKQAQ